MAEKSLFYNALPDNQSVTGYDRNYNADDISDFFRFSFNTGVVKSNSVNNEPTGLKVVATTGRTITVNAGYACINGKPYINDALKSFTLEANGTSANRYDYIVLRYDNNMSVRDTYLALVTGTGTIPTASNLTRSGNKYELMLAYITVAPSAATITQANITDGRGKEELCPWFTAVKGSADYYDAIINHYESVVTMASAGLTVITDLPSNLYNSKYSLIEVYTNGIKEPREAYTASLSGGYIVITFTAQKAAGAKITVELDNFIDGEGMSTALAQYTQWVQEVADLKTANEYNYICNGSNDNILISEIVKAFYSVNDYKSLKLNVIGNIGMTAAATGDGSTSSPYSWFDFTKQVETERVVTIDFSNCSAINPTIDDGTSNYIFKGEVMNIIGANVIANNINTNTSVKIFGSTAGRIFAENCRFWLNCYYNSLIASTGTFKNCRGSVTNLTNNSYAFLTNTAAILRLYGGEYYAYTGDANVLSAIVGQSGADAVSILYGVNAPTVARSNYYQTNAIYQATSGGMINCTDLISALPLTVREGLSNIRGTIAKNKPNLM